FHGPGVAAGCGQNAFFSFFSSMSRFGSKLRFSPGRRAVSGAVANQLGGWGPAFQALTSEIAGPQLEAAVFVTPLLQVTDRLKAAKEAGRDAREEESTTPATSLLFVKYRPKIPGTIQTAPRPRPLLRGSAMARPTEAQGDNACSAAPLGATLF